MIGTQIWIGVVGTSPNKKIARKRKGLWMKISQNAQNVGAFAILMVQTKGTFPRKDFTP
jgi:hypothetical protein